MGSASEDEDDDEPHIRGSSLGLGPLSMGANGPDSVGALGPSDLSVQSISTDSKTTHDDSDQVQLRFFIENFTLHFVVCMNLV